MSNFKMSYVNIFNTYSMVMNTTFKIHRWNSKGMQEKEPNMSVQADRKFHPSESLFGITRQSRTVTLGTEFSICTSHLIVLIGEVYLGYVARSQGQRLNSEKNMQLQNDKSILENLEYYTY